LNSINSKPFIFEHTVQRNELDFLGHVNNKTYLAWMEMVAWKHAQSVGISHDMQTQLNRILAVYENRMQYHAGCYLNDELAIKTWVEPRQGCCKRPRHFEITRKNDQKVVFSATVIYVCISLDNHKPHPVPNEFIEPYFSDTRD